MSDETVKVTFEAKSLSNSGEQYVVIPREYEIAVTLPDGTTLLRWRPIDRYDNGYSERATPKKIGDD